MIEYKTFIGELVDDTDNDRLSLRLHKIKITNNTKEHYQSFTEKTGSKASS